MEIHLYVDVRLYNKSWNSSVMITLEFSISVGTHMYALNEISASRWKLLQNAYTTHHLKTTNSSVLTTLDLSLKNWNSSVMITIDLTSRAGTFLFLLQKISASRMRTSSVLIIRDHRVKSGNSSVLITREVSLKIRNSSVQITQDLSISVGTHLYGLYEISASRRKLLHTVIQDIILKSVNSSVLITRDLSLNSWNSYVLITWDLSLKKLELLCTNYTRLHPWEGNSSLLMSSHSCCRGLTFT